MLKFRIIEPKDSNFLQLEKLRYNAYAIVDDGLDKSKTYYFRKLKERKMIACGAFLDTMLVAGCYISNSQHSLYFEQIFVRKDMQFKENSELHIGSNLVHFVLENKNVIENFFNERFNYAKVEPASSSLKNYYEKLGFKMTNVELDTFHKRI